MNLLLTGSTSGIGLETLKALYPHFDRFILPVRNLEKAIRIASQFPKTEKLDWVEMDLSSMKSVQNAGSYIQENYSEIQVMINNAGGMFPAGKKTEDGFDMTFAVNHLGHFFLFKLVENALFKGKAKIINVSSEAHRIASFNTEDPSLKKSGNPFSAYCQAKLYNILFTKELKKRFSEQGISSFSLHPGAVKTAFGSETDPISKMIIRATQLFFISAKKGAQTNIFLAKTPSEELKSGAYYVRKKPKSSNSASLDPENARALWEYSEECLANLGLL
ncbi:MAG TPA: short-chain dehydrogenase [Algoriphagus sp.]|jgi:NAD(P)-dependent dehydrogenase (short-subunit alcohol dehydrogenase family)|uniref:SDR family NAD(P)-dependent oxidoreductase n=1 Tax=unclassified Algoriphagus TaxID=2641541 RepID=UPI000C624266|nr:MULTISPECIES: SDR family NAD(P)-dependent oxidoreductase [unclassified Algoriphagus]MAL13486.1 short-chain dehydrogenase [Algoriphagus sp.]MAN85899.1 short-chain dehydrogenase [Algoriphagus sp.]HAD53377.1 short-chain dehydrogenase [Algoriphagus sp.]HAH37367.1 short-chain dehydrogenase [Algoriphagus sp.]HAS58909.1 short-chain dehydrogenase [Algoriphagus sp.]|tara:strand:+ start:1874 stop:2701 length:828 start_codon:yes stop_codon:yes gene_type:complete